MKSALAQASEPVAIIHLAAVVGAKNVLSDKLSHVTNVDNVSKFLNEAANICDLRNFVFASTGHVYAPSNIPLREDSRLGPTSLYAQQKLDAENSLLASRFSDKVSIARIFSVLGFEGDKPGTLGARVMDAIKYPRSVVIPNGKDVRDFLTPEVVGKLLLYLAESSPSGIVNVASGTGFLVQEYVSSKAAARGYAIDSHQFLQTNSEDPIRVADVSKLIEKIGFRTFDNAVSGIF
jgi:UDP-glucose 4-epimerase/GDP-4-dehydro-6-deoxy-D-mannose reductase